MYKVKLSSKGLRIVTDESAVRRVFEDIIERFGLQVIDIDLVDANFLSALSISTSSDAPLTTREMVDYFFRKVKEVRGE